MKMTYTGNLVELSSFVTQIEKGLAPVCLKGIFFHPQLRKPLQRLRFYPPPPRPTMRFVNRTIKFIAFPDTPPKRLALLPLTLWLDEAAANKYR